MDKYTLFQVYIRLVVQAGPGGAGRSAQGAQILQMRLRNEG